MREMTEANRLKYLKLKEQFKGHPFWGKLKHSEETKLKMSISHKGKSNKCKGIPLSDNHKKNISNALKKVNHSGLFKKGFTPWNKGKVCLHLRGANNHRWRNGITSIRNKIEGTYQYKNWHQQILIRDNFTCQHCLVRGGKLEVHHIKPLYILIEEAKTSLPLLTFDEWMNIYTPLWDISNGVTLCNKCHNKTKKGRV